MDDPVQIIQISDPEIDCDVLFARIRENLHQHNLVGPSSFPVFEIVPSSIDATSFPFLEFDLRQAMDAYSKVWIEVVPESGKLPLINHLKIAAHKLVVYYVNQLAERQTRFNAALLRLVNHIIGVQTKNSDFAALYCELAALRDRVERLERQLEKGQ